ncbi:acyltransferase [Dyadobacter chenwenxiniae]|uniref:Acyltransferase n=1 Tax=Dyadobacter chenwenxiniae TaxID=2906456 RepID=A0A9X1PJW4_9BACT|nr:acyltransferase [Dyadobacter chenwenxiniae]MCF0062687.1 acyltransferase [Dyadobacter chenwenxiniae]UON83568.1 acyltransferase [Dyadobacter chenwenxiniae]
MQKHQAFLSYGRGFAITTIVCFHFLQPMALPSFMANAINLGGAGVHFFFFASGYGLMNSKYTSGINFFKARFNRVIKPYYLIITGIFLLNIPLNLYDDGWESYLSHIFLFKMFTSQISSFGGHFWYISPLVQFYLAFPILRYLVNRVKPQTALIIATLISLVYSAWVVYIGQTETRQFNSFFLQFLWEFVLGMAICKTDQLERIISKPIALYAVITTASLAITGLLVIYFGSVGKMYNDFFSFIAYLGICIICYRIRLVSNALYYLDSISFPLYLTHVFVISLYSAKLAINNEIHYFDLPILMLLALLVAIAVNYLTGGKTLKSVRLSENRQSI